MTIHSTNCDAQRTASIAQVVTATAEVLGQEITPAAAEMIATDLAEYQDQQISDGLKACRRELTGRLTLASIIERIQRADGHPEPNEAWAIALKASDEAASVAMTAEIATALHAASPVLASGDEVGARMAFIDRYKRELMQSRSERKPVSWYLSPGHCAQGRADELERMKREKMITANDYALLLEHHGKAAQLPGPEVGAVVALITGRVPTKPLTTEEQIERVRQLRERITRSTQEHEEQQRQNRQQIRDHHERLMARHLELIRVLEAGS